MFRHYFYTDISGDSNGNFGGKKRGISDCRVWSILKNCARESHKVGTICAKQNIVKLASYFRPKLEILKYSREVSLIILVNIECADYS